MMTLFCQTESISQDLSHNQITFLQIELENDSLKLINSNIVPGVLKKTRRHSEKSGILYEVRSSTEKILLTGMIDNPLLKRIEYVDDDGQLRSKYITLSKAIFTIRIPCLEKNHHILFYKVEQPLNNLKKGQANQHLIGSIKLHEKNELKKKNNSEKGTLGYILNNGANNKRINIVFLSEGYTNNEESNFEADAAELLNYVLSQPPHDAYYNYFNAYTIFVASNESGSDHPFRNEYVDTYFNSTYDSYGLKRLITIPPNEYDSNYHNGIGKVDSFLQSHVPDYDIVILIVNDDEYGGAGGFLAITSVNSLSGEVLIHEIGHSFAKLADEYETPWPEGTPREKANSTKETRREFIKWNCWILDKTPIPTPEINDYVDEVGLFEGSQYQVNEWFRPKLNCAMRSIGIAFCAVCQENHIKAIYEVLSPIENFYPDTSFVLSMSFEGTLDLVIYPAQPSYHNLSIRWIVNRDTLSETTNALRLYGNMFQKGHNTVEAFVVDKTSFVRNTTILPLLEDQVLWTVDYTIAATLSYLSISGADQVNEGSTADYTCTAHYSDGSTQNVTYLALWSENSDYSTINSSGTLNSSPVSSDVPCTITANYGGKSAEKNITIKNVTLFWDYTSNTGNNASVILPLNANPNIDGVPLQDGDYVGVFTPAGLCCGNSEWDTGKNMGIPVWGDDPQTTDVDGFQTGETIYYRVYRSLESKEWSNVEVDYLQGTGFYSANAYMVINKFIITESGTSLPPNWAFTSNTGNNGTVILPITANPNIDGTPLQNDDYVGVFTPAGLCCGYSRWDSAKNMGITVWGDNSQTIDVIDGFRAGENIDYRVFSGNDLRECSEIDFEYVEGMGLYSPNCYFVLNKFDISTVVNYNVFNGLPAEFILHANYPNPFNPETTIKYQLPHSSHVVLSIVNLMGQEVIRLVDKFKEAGYHTTSWNGKNDRGEWVPSGVYIYRINISKFQQSKKLIFNR